jgi:hypothetical protein
MATGVLAGLLANSAFGWWWLDPVVAIATTVVAVNEGHETWHGEGCGCATFPGLQEPAEACREDCCT